MLTMSNVLLMEMCAPIEDGWIFNYLSLNINKNMKI